MKKVDQTASIELREKTLAKLYNDLSTGKRKLADFPEKARTYPMCLHAVKFDGLQYSDVPKKCRTEEMAETAILQNINAIKLVNPKHVPMYAYLHALILKAISLEDVPKNKRSYEVCLYGVRQNGLDLALCPLNKFSDKQIETLCETAVEVTPKAITLVPSYYRSNTMYLKAIKKNPALLTSIPQQDEYFYSDAIRLAPGVIYYVPSEFQTYKLYKEAVIAYGENLQYVPYGMRDEEMCQLAYTYAIDKKEIEQYIPAHILASIKKQTKEISSKKESVQATEQSPEDNEDEIETE